MPRGDQTGQRNHGLITGNRSADHVRKDGRNRIVEHKIDDLIAAVSVDLVTHLSSRGRSVAMISSAATLKTPACTPDFVVLMPTSNLNAPELYFNRELSLLEFNRRVLELAKDDDVPLLERLSFLCIANANLDEF